MLATSQEQFYEGARIPVTKDEYGLLARSSTSSKRTYRIPTSLFSPSSEARSQSTGKVISSNVPLNFLYHTYAQMQTSLVRAVVQECGAHLKIISPRSVHRAHAGESERILRETFAEASSHVALGKPSVIFFEGW
ncbi:hypothetical protein L6164_026647 [Bauhinia variegata]|uniref:Uncharacterized protein n=1 Tax=Bauhinia variegata TaxID=167791 RepID=A0ACB9LRP3_BAUVA|nr:hypothetical protein L6164_026647 [Bauhinia variegata]